MSNATLTTFRNDFPEFQNVAAYPDSMVNVWLTVATNLVNPDRWADLTALAQELVTAHYVVLAARDRTTAQLGKTPGATSGLQTAKAVGDVSASYDFSATVDNTAANWNQTSYGQRYWQLARMAGAGGVQLPC